MKALALLVISSIIIVLLAEVLLRVLDLAPTRDLYTVNEQQFSSVPGIYAPGQVFDSLENPALPHRVTINSLGYRGAAFPNAKDEGELRIFVVGDSLTYGDFVNDNETLPARLEEFLRSQCGHVRVVNAGLRGGTIVGEAELIKRGLDVGPDIVVLVFHENDLTDLADPLWLQLERNRHRKSRFPLSVVYPLLRETAIWNLALRAVARVRAERLAQAPVMATAGGASPGYPLEALKTRYAHELDKLRSMLTEQGIDLLFVTYPGHHALTAGTAQADFVDWANLAAARAGVPALNLVDALRASGRPTETLYLLPHDGHPSADGHAVAARAISDRLVRDETLQGRCKRDAR